MLDAQSLWLYFLMVFGVVALPGMDMAFVSASAVLGGRRAAQAALAGIVLGGLGHVVMGAAGISAVLQGWPALYRLLALAGALYLAWIGFALVRANRRPVPVSVELAPSVRRGDWSSVTVARQALLTCLLNPKAYLFMLAIFPQFLRPQAGSIWPQAMVLWAIGAVSQVVVYGTAAWVACRVNRGAARHPWRTRGFGLAVGTLFMAVAAWMAVDAWRSP